MYTASGELGSTGATVSASDSGTPAWTVVTLGSGATFTYSSTGGCKRGTNCYAWSTGVTSVNAFVAWTINGGASTTAQTYRMYIDPADMTGAPVIARGMDSGGVNQCWRLIYTGGTVVLRDNPQVVQATSSALSGGTRYRVEWSVVGTTTGAARLLVYVGESLTPTYDSGVVSGNWFAAIQQVRFGAGAAGASIAGKIDDVAVDDSSGVFIGPVVQTVAPATIASAQAVQTSVVTTNYTATPPGVPGSERHGATRVAKAVTPVSVESRERFGNSAVTGSYTVSGIRSAEVFGAISVVYGQTVKPASIPSAERFGAGRLRPPVVLGHHTADDRNRADRRDPGNMHFRRDRYRPSYGVFNKLYIATAEGGANGATVNIGDTGSGQPFDIGNIGASATFTYATSKAKHGLLGYAYSCGASSVTSYRGWTVSGVVNQWHRVYIDPADFVGAVNIPVARGSDPSNTQCWRLTLNTDTTLNLRRADNGVVITTPPLTSGIATRAEWQVRGTTTGMARLLLFVGEGAVPFYDSWEVGGDFRSGATQLRWGLGVAITNVSGALDDAAWSDTGWIGGVPITIPLVGIPSAQAVSPSSAAAGVKPAGVPSSERFGRVSVSYTATTNGLQSAESFGQAVVGNAVKGPSVGSAVAFGKPTVAQGIRPAGIPSSETFGKQAVSRTAPVKGIVSSERFGTATVSTTNPTAPPSVKSAEVFGRTSVVSVYTVTPVGIPSNERFGAGTVYGPGSVLSPRGIGSSERFGASTVTQIIKPVSVTSSERFGAVTTSRIVKPVSVPYTAICNTAVATSARSVGVVGVPSAAIANTSTGVLRFVRPEGIKSAEAFGKPSNSLTLRPVGGVSSEAFGRTTVAYTIKPVSVTTAEKFGTAAARQDSVITPKGIPSAEAIGRTATTQVVKPAGIVSAERFGNHNPHTIGFPQTVTPVGVPSAGVVGVGRFVTRIIQPATVTSGERFGRTAVAQVVKPVGVASVEIFGSNKVAQAIKPVSIGSAEKMTTVSSAQGIKPSTILTGEKFGTPRAGARIAPAPVPTGERHGKTTVTPGSVALKPAPIGSAERFGVPSVTASLFIRPKGIPSAERFGGDTNLSREADVHTDIGEPLIDGDIATRFINVDIAGEIV